MSFEVTYGYRLSSITVGEVSICEKAKSFYMFPRLRQHISKWNIPQFELSQNLRQLNVLLGYMLSEVIEYYGGKGLLKSIGKSTI